MSRISRARKNPQLSEDTEYEQDDIESMVREAVASIRNRNPGGHGAPPAAPAPASRPIPIPRRPTPAPRKTRVQVIQETDDDYYAQPQPRTQSLPPTREEAS